MNTHRTVSLTDEWERDEVFREVKAKLETGAAQAERGELFDGDEAFDELREVIEGRRIKRGG